MDVKMERMTRRSWFYNCISTEQILHNLFINNMPPFADYLGTFIGKFGRFKLYQNSWQPHYITVEILYKGWDMICAGGFMWLRRCCYFPSFE